MFGWEDVMLSKENCCQHCVRQRQGTHNVVTHINIPCHPIYLFCTSWVIRLLLDSSQDTLIPRNLAHHQCCFYKWTRSRLLGMTSLKEKTEEMTILMSQTCQVSKVHD